MTLTTNDYYEIASQIEDGSNSIEFEKDGETLFIECALESEHTKGTGKASNLVQVFFDLEKQAWRSFNKWNLLSIG